MSRAPKPPNATFERLMNTRVAQEDRFEVGDLAVVNVGGLAGRTARVTRVWFEDGGYRVELDFDYKVKMFCQFRARDLSNLGEQSGIGPSS
jgi:hypothetical protein